VSCCCPRCAERALLTRAAIAFTYFEALLRAGDVHRFDAEEARLSSLGNLLDQIGYARDIWIDFAEEAFALLHRLADSLRHMDGQAPDILLHAFNDMNESMAIITYVKLLASAWVQTHPDDFRHFVPMGDVKAYCANNIEPTQCEADNIGIAALAEALVKPAGFGLEVWYLDRSPGEEINRSFYAEPTDHHHMPLANPPMLRLLYRPYVTPPHPVPLANPIQRPLRYPLQSRGRPAAHSPPARPAAEPAGESCQLHRRLCRNVVQRRRRHGSDPGHVPQQLRPAVAIAIVRL
jgi:hypothetical protein